MTPVKQQDPLQQLVLEAIQALVTTKLSNGMVQDILRDAAQSRRDLGTETVAEPVQVEPQVKQAPPHIVRAPIPQRTMKPKSRYISVAMLNPQLGKARELAATLTPKRKEEVTQKVRDLAAKRLNGLQFEEFHISLEENGRLMLWHEDMMFPLGVSFPHQRRRGLKNRLAPPSPSRRKRTTKRTKP